MDKLDCYREIIESKLNDFVAVSGRALGSDKFRDEAVFDYGKIVIQEDWTEHGLAKELEEAGVPKSEIVLGFQPPEVRPLTGYAVAA